MIRHLRGHSKFCFNLNTCFLSTLLLTSLQFNSNSMIQRIQSLYLLAFAILGIILYFFPLYSLIPGVTSTDTSIYMFYMDGVRAVKDGAENVFMRYWSIAGLNFILIAASIFIIFQYKKRKIQYWLCQILSLFVLLLIVLMAFETSQLRQAIGPGHLLMFGWVGLLFVGQIILSRLAARAIKKDDNLVKSADRLR